MPDITQTRAIARELQKHWKKSCPARPKINKNVVASINRLSAQIHILKQSYDNVRFFSDESFGNFPTLAVTTRTDAIYVDEHATGFDNDGVYNFGRFEFRLYINNDAGQARAVGLTPKPHVVRLGPTLLGLDLNRQTLDLCHPNAFPAYICFGTAMHMVPQAYINAEFVDVFDMIHAIIMYPANDGAHPVMPHFRATCMGCRETVFDIRQPNALAQAFYCQDCGSLICSKCAAWPCQVPGCKSAICKDCSAHRLHSAAQQGFDAQNLINRLSCKDKLHEHTDNQRLFLTPYKTTITTTLNKLKHEREIFDQERAEERNQRIAEQERTKQRAAKEAQARTAQRAEQLRVIKLAQEKEEQER